MRVLQQLLIPGVQDTEEAEFRAQMTRISSHLQECLGAGAKQQSIDLLLVLQGQWGQRARQREDHMGVAGGQQVALPRCQPAVASVGLALGAVPVAAGVEGDGTMPATRALIHVAAERRRTTSHNGMEHFQMPPGEPLVAAIEERVSRGTDDIGHLQRWPRHLLGAGRVGLAAESRQPVQRTGGSLQVQLRDMQVDAGFLQVVVSQQQLDGAQVCAILQQVGGKAVAEGLLVLHMV